jgi:NAD(P)-dependent dehydrogenase (short-subunit alcohol dehydrogenase family)
MNDTVGVKTQAFSLKQLMAMYNFTGKTLVVTGGAGILGSEFACAFAGCGGNVAILDLNLEPGQAVLQRMGKSRSRAALVQCDVLDPESLRQATAEVVRRFGQIDCLINAAGGNQPQATTSADRSFFELPADGLRRITDLNILGTILACQAIGSVMAQQGHGAIVNIASVNSSRPLSRGVAYAAGKAAVANFTQWLAVHLAQEYSPCIRVNAIAPGFFITTQNQFLLANAETGEYTPRAKAVVAHTPMGRFGKPGELVGGMLWLLSPAASFVTGSVVYIDGGFTAYSGV